MIKSEQQKIHFFSRYKKFQFFLPLLDVRIKRLVYISPPPLSIHGLDRSNRFGSLASPLAIYRWIAVIGLDLCALSCQSLDRIGVIGLDLWLSPCQSINSSLDPSIRLGSLAPSVGRQSLDWIGVIGLDLCALPCQSLDWIGVIGLDLCVLPCQSLDRIGVIGLDPSIQHFNSTILFLN